jgi:hypothetical protein
MIATPFLLRCGAGLAAGRMKQTREKGNRIRLMADRFFSYLALPPVKEFPPSQLLTAEHPIIS